MSKQLYKLTDNYQTLAGMLDNEDYNPDDIKNMLDNVKEAVEDKVESIAKLVLSLEGDTEVIKAEQERLKARREAVNNNIDWLRNYILTGMLSVGLDKVKREVLTVSVRLNPPSVEVIESNDIPEEFRNWTWEPRKREMVGHFKETGEIVAGINIITDKKSIVIR